MIIKYIKTILFPVGAYLIFKACSLYWAYFHFIDGDGIGVHLLGFEINDKVLTRNIPIYATVIITIGIILILPLIISIFSRTNQA